MYKSYTKHLPKDTRLVFHKDYDTRQIMEFKRGHVSSSYESWLTGFGAKVSYQVLCV